MQQISLEFFTRKRKNWPLNFQSENIPWEIWTIKIDLMQLSNENGIKKELYDAWSRALLQRVYGSFRPSYLSYKPDQI